MAISIDWGNSIINIPRNDMILIQTTPIEVRQLNIDDFRKTLNDLQDDSEGMPFPTTHSHVAPISVGGVALARVIEILEPYTITFEDGAYAVNIVGGNSNIADRVNINNVSIRTANSAGLPDLAALQSASFEGTVHISANSQYNGTTYPVGLRAYPVNNVADAVAIASKYSISSITILEDHIFDTGDNLEGFEIDGVSASTTTLIFNAGANVKNCKIINAVISGNLDGGSLLERCVLSNLNYINGFVYNCMLASGIISLGGTDTASFLDCFSGNAGAGPPTIDCNGGGLEDTPLAIRGYNGGIKLIHKTGTADCSIDLASGQVIIDSSCTTGEIIVRGDGKVVDENGGFLQSGTYNGALTLLNETSFGGYLHDIWKDMGLSNTEVSEEKFASQLENKIWDAPTANHTTAGSFGAFIQSKLLTVAKFLGLK